MILFFFSLFFFLNLAVLLCFEGHVCNGEMSPLDGRNDSRKAQGDPRCEATKPRGPRHRVGLSPVVSGHRVGRHQVEMPSRCLLSPPVNTPRAARLPAPSPAFEHPSGRGEWYPGRDEASAVRRRLENGKPKSRLDHLRPPFPGGNREGSPK